MIQIHLQNFPISFANDAPFVLIGGVNVLESRDFAVEVAGHYKTVCQALGTLCSRRPTTRPTAPRFIRSVARP